MLLIAYVQNPNLAVPDHVQAWATDQGITIWQMHCGEAVGLVDTSALLRPVPTTNAMQWERT